METLRIGAGCWSSTGGYSETGNLRFFLADASVDGVMSISFLSLASLVRDCKLVNASGISLTASNITLSIKCEGIKVKISFWHNGHDSDCFFQSIMQM